MDMVMMMMITNFSFSLQLSERHFIGLSKTLKFIVLSGIICQERALHRHTSVNIIYQTVHSNSPFSFNKTK